MVSFELGKEIEKNVFRLVTRMGQRKKTELYDEIKRQLILRYKYLDVRNKLHIVRTLSSFRKGRGALIS